MTRIIRSIAQILNKGSLRTKIIVWSFVPTAIILLIVALITFDAYQNVTGELVIERDRELIRLSASQLATGLAEYTDLLDSLARGVDAYRDDVTAQRDVLKGASNRLADFDGGLFILDTFGEVVAFEPERPGILAQDWSDRTYYGAILRAHIADAPTPFFSDIVTDRLNGTETIVVAVPIISDQGEFLGVVGGMFRLGATTHNAFYANIIKLHIGESGSVYLVDGQGRVIYHSDASRFGTTFASQEVVQSVLSGESGAIRTRDFKGRDIVAGYAPVPGTSWGLVTEESWSALTQSSQSYRRFLLLLLAVGVAIPTLVVTIGVRRITRPIAELINAAQEVAQGNFGRTIKAHTGDEVEELADQFNLMSAQLQAWYTHLEKRVADRTKELAALNAIATVVSRSLDLEEILNNALDKTLEVTGREAGGIYLLQEDQLLTLATYRGFDSELADAVDQVQMGEAFSGRVAQSGQPLVVRDLSVDPRSTRALARESGFHALGCFPLVSRGKVLGVLFVLSHSFREFSRRDIELLTSIGSQIGVAVENARLFAQVEQGLQELKALYSADEELYSYLDLDQVLQALVDVAVDILRADKSALMVWDDERTHLVMRVARGFGSQTIAQMSIAPGQGVVGHVAATGELMIVDDALADSRVCLPITDLEGIRSFLNVPIRIGGEIFGVFIVGFTELHAFDAGEQRLFAALAQRAALAIENAQLYEQAQQAAAFQERQRLARDLHDAVTQTLFSASLIADVLPRLWKRDPQEGRRRLEEVRQLTRGALAEMRILLLELRPSALVEAELDLLLRQLAESVTGRARVPVAVDMEGTYPLPLDVKVALYRITHEALNNVAKHAGAGQATVNLRCIPPTSLRETEEGHIELRVSDDGRGFDPGAVPPKSLGLGIMRERAEAIGATLTVTSEIGRGTEVTVVWSDAPRRAEID